MFERLKYWVWLSCVPGMGAKKRCDLARHFGDPVNIWNASKKELGSVPFITAENAEMLLDRKIKSDTARIMEELYKHDIKAATINDEDYPYYLKNIYDPPVVLYYKGQLKKDEFAIAIVGSRKATFYGVDMAESIAAGLSAYDIAIVSGLARGIDSNAHTGALKAGGRTIGVMGCGLDIVYPSENSELAERVESSGAVVSEYVPGMPPLPANFPARNRIISGISRGVLVIEASERSGSLITVNFALEQGREVFAVPGNVGNMNSTGTNRLIKEGAKMVTCMEDILEELNLIEAVKAGRTTDKHVGTQNSIFSTLDEDERSIAECLLSGPMHIDALMNVSGLAMQVLNSALVIMELKGLVEQTPGKYYKLRI